MQANGKLLVLQFVKMHAIRFTRANDVGGIEEETTALVGDTLIPLGELA